MKTTLWLTTFSMFLTAPLGFSKTEVETLRSTVNEQERQIRQLEDENMKLRSLNGQSVKAPVETATASTKPTAAPAASTSTGGSNTIYTVRAGDTLAKIARNTGSSADSLAKLNNIKDAKLLSIGQKLKVPGESKPTAAVANSPAPVAPSAVAGNDTYIIRDGDTFYSIAKKYKTTPESIAAANPGIKASELRTGQLIRLNGKTSASSTAARANKTSETVANRPAASSKPAAAATETPKPVAQSKPAAPTESKPVAEPKPAAANRTSSPAASANNSPASAPAEPVAKTAVHSVTIDGEMTYGEFATKHGTQIERLNELNGLDLTQNTVLAKGSELYVTAQP
jgi:LysM repeat protein